ncbi:MAG: three-Cys-motif partner protein TcmP [Chloroflexi bacterium]|nr:three-Cys-motif partner protein TcmP [Chloroflexota bacterium]
MKQANPKTNLLEHSEAKVNLYGKYLSVYLNILHRAQFVKRIFVFDLFCGEGVYENDAKGSPIIALDCIRNHYDANQNSCPDMTVWFSDNGISEIENEIYKVERVERIGSKIFRPDNVEVKFYKENYESIYPKAIDLVSQTKDSKGLFFIDPFGYKAIKPDDIRKMLENGKTEVFLWLPIAHMYRFADSALHSSFPGSEPLKLFLNELFGKPIPSFRSPHDFIEKLKERFRAFLKDLSVFVDTFILERDSSNVYCLFFFTRNIRGYEKMLEAKWSMDPSRGKGHSLEKTISLFDETELSGYHQKLLAFIESADCRTNWDLYLFGLENNFLPKHTKSVLDGWKKNETKFEVVALDSKPVRGYYIEYNPKRRVAFKLVK